MTSDNSTTVTYKDIPGFPGYMAGSDGTIWSCRHRGRQGSKNPIASEKYRRLAKNLSKGERYLKIKVSGKAYPVHSLILLAFFGPRPSGMECCHNDGNRLNNAPSNLRWGTRSSNASDRARHGNQSPSFIKSKLTTEIILAIRSEYVFRKITSPDLAKKYGVAESTIRGIVSRRTWTHI